MSSEVSGPAAGSGPALTAAGSGPALTAAGSGPALTAAGSGPALTAAGSGPALTAAGSGPALTAAGSGPALTAAGSGPALTAAGSGPALTAAGSGPALTAAGSGPALTAAGSGPALTAAGSGPALTAAQRARMERQRQRARALHDARVPHHNIVKETGPAHARDTGGGFLLEEAAAGADGPRAPAHPPAPLPHRSQQPHCLECQRPFPHSYLFDTFDYSVCDACRDDEEAHALMTRTEAKSEYLLKDCDLDKRAPALRCVRRRNPHRAGFSDMRLYLRAQVAARALAVWGGEEALEREREERGVRRARAQETSTRRRLRELRLAARSALLDGRRAAPHEHAWGPEAHDAAADTYSRACTACPHTETYEKM